MGIITVAQFLQNLSQSNPRFIFAINVQLFELMSALEHSLGEQGMDSPPLPTGLPVWRKGGTIFGSHNMWQHFLRNKKASSAVDWRIRTVAPQHLEQFYCQRDTADFLGCEASVEGCAVAAMLVMISNNSSFQPDFYEPT